VNQSAVNLVWVVYKTIFQVIFLIFCVMAVLMAACGVFGCIGETFWGCMGWWKDAPRDITTYGCTMIGWGLFVSLAAVSIFGFPFAVAYCIDQVLKRKYTVND
jgi:hypothetical protein